MTDQVSRYYPGLQAIYGATHCSSACTPQTGQQQLTDKMTFIPILEMCGGDAVGGVPLVDLAKIAGERDLAAVQGPVSYTHLTLPTKKIV